MRASKPVVMTGAVALLASMMAVPAVSAQQPPATAGQQPAPAGQQPAPGATGQQPAAGAKNYKDRAEYDLYLKITQTADPKARLELLNTWQDKYPQTDYSTERNQYYLATLSKLAATDPAQQQKLIDKSSEILKADAANFQAAYFITLYGPTLGKASPAPELATQVDSAAHVVISGADDAFSAAKKPPSVDQAAFDKAKAGAVAVAHNSLAWEATTKKDLPTVESEYKASLQADPNQPRISAAYGQVLVGEKKFPEGLFEYARAAQYDGPGALPAAQKQAALDYFNKVYTQFHGSDEGKQQLLDQAKTSAVPPDNMQLSSQADTANKQAEAMNARMASDPAFKLWYSIESSLKADNGPAFFTSNMKEVEVPAGAQGVKNFTGTVITIDPPDRPMKVTLGVEDPAKPDATLEFSQPLPASALDKIKVGEKLDFGGVVDSFNKDPYMLTFKDPTVPGVQTTAPARKATKHR